MCHQKYRFAPALSDVGISPGWAPKVFFFKSNMSDPSAVNTVSDNCCLCGFVFVDKKRTRSITGEFAEIFANVCKSIENILARVPTNGDV